MAEDSEGSPGEDLLDDWFIESLKMYNDLYVYQLEHPTRVLEWTSAKSVCVAGNSSGRCEILELELPPRLSAAGKQGLCAGRDFRVLHGGFSEAPIHHLAHVPGTRCIVTNNGRSSQLQVWEVAEDSSDVIRRCRTIEGCSSSCSPVAGSRVAARRWACPQVLHGATCSQVQLTDLTSGQKLFNLESEGAEPLSCLQFLSSTVFLAGQCEGAVLLADVRTPAAVQLSVPPPCPDPTASSSSAFWWTAVAADRPDDARLLRVASSGLMETSDIRKGGGVCSRARLHVPTGLGPLANNIAASWAPALDGCIAVSGFGGAVHIFDTSSWGAELQDARPLFEHHGHAPSPGAITTSAHVWHPERPRTLLSAATDGSVHVWDWIDQSAGG